MLPVPGWNLVEALCAFCLCFSLGKLSPTLQLLRGLWLRGARCLASASSPHPHVLQYNAPWEWALGSRPSQEASEPTSNGFSCCLCGLSTSLRLRKLLEGNTCIYLQDSLQRLQLQRAGKGVKVVQTVSKLCLNETTSSRHLIIRCAISLHPCSYT